MYQDKALQESIKKVEAARAENVKLNPRRMTAEEKNDGKCLFDGQKV